MIKLTLTGDRGPIVVNPQYITYVSWAWPAEHDDAFVPSTTLLHVAGVGLMEVVDSIESINKQLDRADYIRGEVLPFPSLMGLQEGKTPDLPKVEE